MDKKRLISFVLWGSDPKYTQGAIRNAELARDLYPGWTPRFYVASSVPSAIIDKLLELNAEVLAVDHPGNWTSMFWRFAPAAEADVAAMISRDCDSRLSMREKVAVDAWMQSDKGFHIMRDHPFHKYPIMGGMWGVKAGVLSNLDALLEKFPQHNTWGVDQAFLSDVIFPIVKDNCLIHDEFFQAKLFPTPRASGEYVGEIYDQYDKPDLPLRQILMDAISKKSVMQP